MATLEGVVWSIGKKGVLIGSAEAGGAAIVTIAGLANLSTDADGKVLVGTGESKKAISDNDVKVEYEAVTAEGESEPTSYKGKVTLGQTVLAMTAKAAVSLTNGKIDGKNFAGVLDVSSRAVAIANKEGTENSSEKLVYTAKNGTAAIVANLTEGYNLAANGLSASYSAAGEVTLATISGLQKGLAEGSTVLDTMTISDTAKDDGTGIVTLTKAQDGNDMFTNSNIKIDKNTKNAFANTQNYTLALGGDYKQVAQPNYWEIAKAGTATYKFETPEGYVYNNTAAGTTSDTQINYQKAFTTVIATVTGLNADAEVGEETPEGSTTSNSVVGTSAYNETTKKYEFTTGLTITDVGTPTGLNAKGVATNKGDFIVTVKDNVLPNTKGTLKVTPGTNYQVKADGGFVTDSADNDAVKISETATHDIFTSKGLYKNIWVINGNTAVYKKVRLGYYNTSVANQMAYVPQADVITFLTITGLSSEALATNANYENVKGSNVITSIDGFNWTTAPDAEHSTNAKGQDVWTKKTEAGVLTIADPTKQDDLNWKPEYSLFDKRNITIGKSDNVKLKIDADLAPTFSEQKWNLSGTSATLKGTIKGGYTSSDDGKTIIYTADTQNATLATISGLKKGTVLTSSASDSRTIGYGSGDSFKQGIEHSTSVLSYANTADATTGTNKLNKLDIEISANVLDTSKVALKSTFYKLKLDDGTDKGGAVVTKADPNTEPVKYFTVSGTTATYKQAASRPFYTIDSAGTSITYTKEASPITLATIKGISANTNINIYDTKGENNADVASAQNTDNDIYIDNSTGVITIKKGALNGTAITVTKATKGIPKTEEDKTYTFALDSNVDTSKLKWTQTGNTVYLKADSGYAVSANGQTINYTKDGGQQTIIAQITGLQAGLFDSETDAFTTDATTGDVSVNSEVTAKGITLDNTAGAGSITLSLKALNNANVALTGAGGYKLAVKTTGGDTEKVPTEAKSGQETWVVNGTTAIFKAVDTSYYALDANKNTLTYKKAADIKGAKVYATITGIKDGLLVNPSDATKLGHYVTETNESTGETTTTFENVIEITGTTGNNPAPVIKIVHSYALDGKDIVLNAKGSLAGATIEIDPEATDITDAEKTKLTKLMTAGLVDENKKPSWSVNNKGVATYTGSVKAYYTNEDGKIAYHAANTSATIATITGLKTGLTADDLTSLNPSTVSGKENEITLKGSLLAGKDVALTTNIQLTGKDYKLVASNTVGEKFATYNDVNRHKGWSITGSTATYGEYTDGEYYELNTDGNELTYKAAGFNKEFAKLSGTGLKSGLVTIKNDALSEITPATNNGITTFTLTGDAINVGGDVKVEDLNDTDTDTETYKLAIGSGIKEPTTDYTCVTEGGTEGKATDVTIFEGMTDGYTLDTEGISLTYDKEKKIKSMSEAANNAGNTVVKYGQIIGLKSGIKADSDGKVTGIKVTKNGDKKVITLSKAVLPTSNVTTNDFDNNTTLALDTDVSESKSDSTGFSLKDGVLSVYTGCTSAGYALASGSKGIDYTKAAIPNNVKVVVSIKGLNISDFSDIVNEIDGIKIDDQKTITLSEDVLGADTVEFNGGDNGYKFALDTGVTKTKQTTTWAFDQNKGTATYTEKVDAGYALDGDTKITYTPSKTVTSTLTNLNKNDGIFTVTNDANAGTGTITNIKLDNGVFKLSAAALANKKVTLTTKSTVKGDDPGYKLGFAADNIAAKKLDYVVTKTKGDTKATITQTTESGYSLSANGKEINYNSDPTTVTLATISGLNKEIESEANTAQNANEIDFATKIDGITITAATDSAVGSIEITDSKVLTTGHVTLGKSDNYAFKLGSNITQTKDSTGKESFVTDQNGVVHRKSVIPAYYETTTDTTGKTITYHAADTSGTPIFKITGLNANAVPDANGAINGIEVNDTTVTLNASVLGTNANTPIEITGTGKDYTLALDSDVIENTESNQWKEQTEWVAEGSNYIYRTYDKGYYTKTSDNKITYTAPVINKNNNFVTISGLAADMVKTLNTQAKTSGLSKTSGKITLTADMLNGKQVKLTTKGNHTLALDSNVVKSTITTSDTGEGWSTNKTTATLKGTISEGYAVNEAGNIVNYYNANKSGQTIATISNLASGAEIKDNNVATTSDGVTTVTLGKDQLGTKNVTIKGDFYKLAVANDGSQSQTDTAKWVKAANKTVATYTQTTYKGFSPSADGKTLTYLAKTTDLNLATVSGLNKDITTDNMAVDGKTNGTNNKNALVNLTTTDSTITINDTSALNPGNVTLGKTDAYKLALKNGVEFGAHAVTDHLTVDKGTASVMKGTSEGWTYTNDKQLTYTKADEKPVSTVKGLAKDSDSNSVTLENNNIVLGKSAVKGTKSITLTNTGGEGNTAYKFAFQNTGEDSITPYDANAGADSERWDISGTTVTITDVKSEGYKLEDEKVTYQAASNGDVVATITGLPNKMLKKSSDGKIVLSNGVPAINKVGNGNTIQLTKEFRKALVNTDATISITSNKYSFDTTGVEGADDGNLLLQQDKANGTAIIKKHTGEKWSPQSNGGVTTAIIHEAEKDTTYVTIKGLKKDENNTVSYEANATNITLNSANLTSNNVTMTRGNSGKEAFKFVFADDVNQASNSSSWANQTEWVTTNGSATYKLYDKANYYLKEDTKNNLNSVIYVAPTKGTQFAVISGMAKNATLGASIGTGSDNGTITLGKDQLEGITKAVTLKVTKAKDVVANDKKGISAEDAAATNALIKTGNTTAADFKLALDSDIKASLLSTAEDAVWDTNGTKAVLTGTVKQGYALSNDKMSITYNAADKRGQAIATVTGLKSGSQITNGNVKYATEANADGSFTNTITLNNEHLGAYNVAVSGLGYKLALDKNVITLDENTSGAKGGWKDQTGWVANKGTFVYKTYDKAYWELNEAETTAIYHKPVDENPAKVEGSKHQTYVTIKGLKANITGDTTLIGGITEGSVGAQSIGSDLTGRVITLNDDVLNKTTVTLADSSGFGYALGLDEEVDKSTVDETAAAVSTAKGGITTVTWTGTKGIGYHVTNDGQSIEYYSAPRAKQTIAQVTGFKPTTTKEDVVADYNGTNNVVTLSGNSLTSAVGISGTAEFSFDAEFKDGTITGSKVADKVSVAGSGVTVNTGKGNDYVDLGESGNTFFYANGDGNDVIANFTAGTDKIKITNVAQKDTDKKGNESTLIEVVKNGSDAVVKVNNVNAIRLNGLASSVDVDALKDSIYDKDNKNLNGKALEATGNVLADDNFATTPQLSSIVKASASTYSTEDLVATDATSLTKQSSAIAYSGSSKK